MPFTRHFLLLSLFFLSFLLQHTRTKRYSGPFSFISFSFPYLLFLLLNLFSYPQRNTKGIVRENLPNGKERLLLLVLAD
jgi:hypothetical protein